MDKVLGKVPELTVSHAHALIDRITQDDDAAHASDLLELICGIADPKNVVAIEVEKHLYSLTPDFHSHFKDYLKKLRAA